MSYWNGRLRQPGIRLQPRPRAAGKRRCTPMRHGAWPRAPWMLMFLCAAMLVAGIPTVEGQGPEIDREYVLKAAYLYKFATYIRWPREAFADAQSPFVIAVLGPDPVGAHLRTVAAVKTVEGRKIVIRHFQQPSEVRDCHILFMTRAVDDQTQRAAIRKLVGRHVLLVGETKAFLQQGGVIDFVVRQNRIQMYISRRAYEREGLNVSAQLLRVMTVL